MQLCPIFDKKEKRQFVIGKLEDNVGKPKELWKTLKSLGLSATSKTLSKICLGKDKDLSFDPKTNAETFKDFFAGLSQNLVDQLPAPINKFGMESVKGYYQHLHLKDKKNYVPANYK